MEHPTSNGNNTGTGCDDGELLVRVAFVECQAAKHVKNYLEQEKRLRRDVRITRVSEQVSLVAIPIIQDRTDQAYELTVLGTIEGVKDFGFYKCPLSSAMLGNNRNTFALANGSNSLESDSLTLVQSGLLQAVELFLTENRGIHNYDRDDRSYSRIRGLPIEFCPSKLEVFGDDRTLVLSQTAFQNDALMHNLLESIATPGQEINLHSFQTKYLWSNLARVYASHRVVRRGDIDPNSPTRQSGFRLLWISPQAQATTDSADSGSPMYAMDTAGPGSSTWITVTEQGTRQSFDMTRVMFSRGNISEKIRFGKLVQVDEVVLDMYAGIGYFTLPALIHGKAKHVYCCEWNTDAVEALKFNLMDNGVHDLATVFVGDCRILIDQVPLHGMVDRVSLGLLPSSEGGWSTAVKALNHENGGWLHIHGNVPVHEMHSWSVWLSCQLRDILLAHQKQQQQQLLHTRPLWYDDWSVVTTHVEKVKSFAPNVNHYVADVFIGPRARLLTVTTSSSPNDGPISTLQGGSAVVMVTPGECIVLPRDAKVDPPSCALADDGILSQAWMRNKVQDLSL